MSLLYIKRGQFYFEDLRSINYYPTDHIASAEITSYFNSSKYEQESIIETTANVINTSFINVIPTVPAVGEYTTETTPVTYPSYVPGFGNKDDDHKVATTTQKSTVLSTIKSTTTMLTKLPWFMPLYEKTDDPEDHKTSEETIKIDHTHVKNLLKLGIENAEYPGFVYKS